MYLGLFRNEQSDFLVSDGYVTLWAVSMITLEGIITLGL